MRDPELHPLIEAIVDCYANQISAAIEQAHIDSIFAGYGFIKVDKNMNLRHVPIRELIEDALYLHWNLYQDHGNGD